MKTRLFAVVLLVVCLVMCVVPAYAGSSLRYCPNCGNRLNLDGTKTATAWDGCYGTRADTPAYTQCPLRADCQYDIVAYYTDLQCNRCSYYSIAYARHSEKIDHTACVEGPDYIKDVCGFNHRSAKYYALIHPLSN